LGIKAGKKETDALVKYRRLRGIVKKKEFLSRNNSNLLRDDLRSFAHCH
jgi:hypothetical protein